MTDAGKPLIVYYSRTGKTRMVAEKLAVLLDADLEEIREAKDRRGVLGFMGAGRDAMRNRPAELTSEHGTEGRTLVILGMPVWANSPPPAVRRYVQTVELAGRGIAAFCTHNGGGGRKAFAKLARMLPAGLFETLELKKPRSGDPGLDALLEKWARNVREGAGTRRRRTALSPFMAM